MAWASTSGCAAVSSRLATALSTCEAPRVLRVGADDGQLVRIARDEIESVATVRPEANAGLRNAGGRAEHENAPRRVRLLGRSARAALATVVAALRASGASGWTSIAARSSALCSFANSTNAKLSANDALPEARGERRILVAREASPTADRRPGTAAPSCARPWPDTGGRRTHSSSRRGGRTARSSSRA